MGKIEGVVSLKEKKTGDLLVLYMSGRLDAVSAPPVEHRVFDFISQGEHKIILDFSNIDYLSSAGMRMLLSVTKKLKNNDGRMVICNISNNVMDILKMSGFDHILDIAKTEENALQKF